MNSQIEQLAILNPEIVTEFEVLKYGVREAVRAVVVDEDNRVALLYVAEEKYYKLPGGGVEPQEDLRSALNRECLEEIGGEVEIIKEIGTITEYRKFCKLKQVSLCYFARLKGEKGIPHYTQAELAQDFHLLWLPYDEAILKLSENQATSIEGREYIIPRDRLFLLAAGEFFYQ